MPRLRAFQYGTLLRVRERQEDLKARALADVRRAIRAAEQQSVEISERQAAMFQRAAHLAEQAFDASDVRRYFQFERHLARLAVEKDSEIVALRAVEEERRAELEEAMKQRRIIERLKERKDEAYAREVNKQEQKISDESATSHAAFEQKRDLLP